MSFRRQRDEWDDFLKKFGSDPQACGIPDFVVADKMRFLVFLDHGYDEWGWAQNHHAFFNSDVLTDDQIARLSRLVSENIDEKYGAKIASRWQRAYQIAEENNPRRKDTG